MLFSLLLKDLLISRYRGLVTLGLALVFLLSKSATLAPSLPIRGFSLVYLVTSMFVLQAAIWEEKCRGDVLLQTLPVTRRQVVASRYLLVVALSSGLAMAYAAALAAGSRLRPPVDAALILRCLAAAVPLPIVLWALVLPVGFRYGMTRSQSVLGLLVFVPVLLIVLPARLIRLLIGLDILSAVRAAVELAPITQLSLALGIAGLVTFASCAMSVRLYERRDF